MYTIGIVESGAGLSSFLKDCLPDSLRPQITLVPAADLPDDVPADLLVISPDLREKRVYPTACQALLVPGRLSPLAGNIPARWAVSYGNSPRDSLTLSTLGDNTIGLALQREVVTLEGDCLDCQEILLPREGHTAPFHVLACAGIQLLLGIPPEEVSVLPRTLPCAGEPGENTAL
ncbi:MAG: hypothetical protein SOR61_03565 [Evtepia sp.]|uniref:hypothetical protein n=1 Tax=Evtepia sp. TaxID=2773933 RepID=UPI002A74F58C|nr:hypothetical protein [Evtepia sp.]MDY3014262.1 hypothetical protein [Evtepia sp.]